jgi:hypothetical protein
VPYGARGYYGNENKVPEAAMVGIIITEEVVAREMRGRGLHANHHRIRCIGTARRTCSRR